MNNKLTQLQKKLNEAIMAQQYTKVVKLQKQIKTEMSRRELVPLQSLLPQMTPEQTEEALIKMHKVFVLADMLYGFAVDFESTIQKYDPSMTLLVTNKVREIKKVSSEITKNVGDLHCDRLSESFGDMCDECSYVIENIIYKYRQREKNMIENEKKKVS